MRYTQKEKKSGGIKDVFRSTVVVDLYSDPALFISTGYYCKCTVKDHVNRLKNIKMILNKVERMGNVKKEHSIEFITLPPHIQFLLSLSMCLDEP